MCFQSESEWIFSDSEEYYKNHIMPGCDVENISIYILGWFKY